MFHHEAFNDDIPETLHVRREDPPARGDFDLLPSRIERAEVDVDLPRAVLLATHERICPF
jgi:hypothetical protein